MRNLPNWLSAVPTIDTSAYADGDLIGTKIEFNLSGYRDVDDLLIRSAILIDNADQAAAVDLVLFGEDPENTTFTDNAAFAPADADLASVFGVISFAAASYQSYSANAACLVIGLSIPIPMDMRDDAIKIYGALVSRGTPTYGAATDLRVRLGIETGNR